LRVAVRALLRGRLGLLEWNPVRVRPGVLADAGDLPRDVASGCPARDLEAVAQDLLGNVELRAGHANRREGVAGDIGEVERVDGKEKGRRQGEEQGEYQHR